MKTEAFVFLIVTIFSSAGYAQTETRVINPVNELRDQLAAVQKGVTDAGLPVKEYPDQLSKVPQYSKLVWLVRDGWRPALNEIDTVAPDEWSKFYLITVMQDALKPREYVDFLNRAADLRQQGKIDDGLLERAAMPDGRLRGILADNSTDPKVRAVVTKLKTTSPTKVIVDLADRTLSGEAKDHLDSLREFESIPRTSLNTDTVIEVNHAKMPFLLWIIAMLAGIITLITIVYIGKKTNEE